MSETDDPDKTLLTYEGGFDAVVARMQARQVPLSFDKGETLPPLDMDFAPLKLDLVKPINPKDFPSTKDRSGNTRKIIEINDEFIGMPELCKLHALLVAHLRKSDQPDHTMALFTRIWAEESAFLFKHLDPRWLVSALTTFGDHGQTEVQRRVGQSMTVLFASMKLYETERLYSGFKPEQEFKLKRLVRRKLPLHMDRYALVGGGLDVNMLARLWLDAKEDAVIAPLAHRMLDLLNRDKATVFRRFKTLRGRKQRQISQKTDGEKPIEIAPLSVKQAGKLPTPSGAQATWGIVSTVKASVEVLTTFVDHHLALGASQITLYLDEPMAKAEVAKLAHPKVTLITCDAAYWERSGKARMDAHQNRQAFNATQAYRSAKTQWLAHIDCDEFLYSEVPIDAVLSNIDTQTSALMMPPAQEIAQATASKDLMFRRTYFDAGSEKSVIRELFPTVGEYLHSGFVSHTTGKTIARVGLPDARFTIHQIKQAGKPLEASERILGLTVLHRHAPDWATFKSHLKFRLTEGSYRKPGLSRLSLSSVLEALTEEFGDAAARHLYDEVCTASPAQIARLEKEGMLIRTRLKARADG